MGLNIAVNLMPESLSTSLKRAFKKATAVKVERLGNARKKGKPGVRADLSNDQAIAYSSLTSWTDGTRECTAEALQKIVVWMKKEYGEIADEFLVDLFGIPLEIKTPQPAKDALGEALADRSIASLVRSLELSRTTVSGWLTGKREPRLKHLRSLHAELGDTFIARLFSTPLDP